MKNSKIAIAFALGVLFKSSFGEEVPKDCVEFTQEIPQFNEAEKGLVDIYLPKIVEVRPRAFLNSYLSLISKTPTGFTFHFSDFEHLRSHQCSGFFTIMADGGFSVTVDLKKELLIWDPGESIEKKFQIKLKRK